MAVYTEGYHHVENDYRIVARLTDPLEAQLIRGCMNAAGIAAVIADEQHTQANLLAAIALGGVRLMVPASDLAQAQDMLAAYERGDFTLADDADVGPAAPADSHRPDAADLWFKKIAGAINRLWI